MTFIKIPKEKKSIAHIPRPSHALFPTTLFFVQHSHALSPMDELSLHRGRKRIRRRKEEEEQEQRQEYLFVC
jgi:hypothetical protein